MPANTPVFGFPYPVGTDRVADGDNAIQALATKNETVVPLKVVMTPLNGTFVQDGPEGCCLWRMPGLVVIRLMMYGNVAANTTIANAPVGLRPSWRCFFTGCELTPAWRSIGFEIDVGGQIRIAIAPTAGGIYALTATYPIAAVQTLSAEEEEESHDE